MTVASTHDPGMVLALIDALKTLVPDADKHIARAGLDNIDPQDRVLANALYAFWASLECNHPSGALGLKLARALNPEHGAIAAMSYAATTCESVGDGFRYFSTYSALLGTDLLIDIHEDDAGNLTVVRRADTHPGFLAPQFSFGLCERWIKESTTHERPLTGVTFRADAPSMDAVHELESAFGCTVTFGAETDSLTMSADVARTTLHNADQRLHRVLRDAAIAELQRIDGDKVSFLRLLRMTIAQRVAESPSIEDVGRAFAMSARTLQRRLNGLDLTYQAVRDDVRKDMAVAYLQNPSLTLSKVGFLLGFSDSAAFSKAFRRWTGKSPSVFRGE